MGLQRRSFYAAVGGPEDQKAGADPHARLKSGFTPMLFAAREGRTEVVRALLKSGDDASRLVPRAVLDAIHAAGTYR